MADDAGFEGWYVIEQMGHKRLAGFLRESVIAGAGFLRIDVPGDDDHPPVTQFIRPETVYALTPATEDLVRRIARSCLPQPVSAYEIREEKPASPALIRRTHDSFDPDDDRDEEDCPL